VTAAGLDPASRTASSNLAVPSAQEPLRFSASVPPLTSLPPRHGFSPVSARLCRARSRVPPHLPSLPPWSSLRPPPAGRAGQLLSPLGPPRASSPFPCRSDLSLYPDLRPFTCSSVSRVAHLRASLSGCLAKRTRARAIGDVQQHADIIIPVPDDRRAARTG